MSATGFNILDGSGNKVDLVTKYELRVSGPTNNTYFYSNTYNKDLGSIFYMNSNLSALGLEGTTGSNCGLTMTNGIDIGSLFCTKGTVVPSSIIINGNFSNPVVATNTYIYNPVTVPNWTKSSNISNSNGLNIAICNGICGFQCATLPSQQYFAIQFYNANGTIFISQSVYLSIGNYNLSFYSWPRPNFYNAGISLSVYIDAINLTPTALTYAAGANAVLTTKPINISTAGNYDFKFAGYNSAGGDTTICFTKISLIPATNTSIINNLISGVTPWGIYDALLWDGSTLPEARGNGRNVTSSGTIAYSIGNGNGATGSIPSISGGVTSMLTWPSGSIPTDFTICGISRYTNPTVGVNRERTFAATHVNSEYNFLLGYWAGKAGVAYWGGASRDFRSNSNGMSPQPILTNWLVSCGKSYNISNTASKTVLMNGSAVGTTTGGSGGGTLCINGFLNPPPNLSERSDWSFTYLVIYDSVLTDAQMVSVSDKLQNYLVTGSMV